MMMLIFMQSSYVFALSPEYASPHARAAFTTPPKYAQYFHFFEVLAAVTTSSFRPLSFILSPLGLDGYSLMTTGF